MKNLARKWGLSARTGLDRIGHSFIDAALDRFGTGYPQPTPSDILVREQNTAKRGALETVIDALEDDLEGIKGFSLNIQTQGKTYEPVLVADSVSGERIHVRFDTWNGQYLIDVSKFEKIGRRNWDWQTQNTDPIARNKNEIIKLVREMAAFSHGAYQRDRDVTLVKRSFYGAVAAAALTAYAFSGDDEPSFTPTDDVAVTPIQPAPPE